MKIKLHFILVLIFIGIVIISIFGMSKKKKAQSPRSYIAYTLVQRQSVINPGSSEPVIIFEATRYRRSNGDFVEIRTKDGKDFYLAFSHQGKFLNRNYQQDYLTEISKFRPDLLEMKSEEAMLKSSLIRKEEPTAIIEGIKCYVLREEKDGVVRDTYLAPSLGTILKMAYVNNKLGASLNLDTLSITYGEPDNKVFDNLPINLPIRLREIPKPRNKQ